MFTRKRKFFRTKTFKTNIRELVTSRTNPRSSVFEQPSHLMFLNSSNAISCYSLKSFTWRGGATCIQTVSVLSIVVTSHFHGYNQKEKSAFSFVDTEEEASSSNVYGPHDRAFEPHNECAVVVALFCFAVVFFLLGCSICNRKI